MTPTATESTLLFNDHDYGHFIDVSGMTYFLPDVVQYDEMIAEAMKAPALDTQVQRVVEAMHTQLRLSDCREQWTSSDCEYLVTKKQSVIVLSPTEGTLVSLSSRDLLDLLADLTRELRPAAIPVKSGIMIHTWLTQFAKAHLDSDRAVAA